MTESKRSISIKGAGDVSGGQFENLRIYGAGAVRGRVKADGVRIWGAGSICGTTQAKTIRIAGSGTFAEGVDAERLVSLGASEVQGPIHAQRVKCIGHAAVVGPIEADEVRAVGHLECEKSVVAEVIHLRGAVSVKGLLSADRIDIHLGGPSRCEEIGGERIRVFRRSMGERARVLSVLDRVFGTPRAERRLTAESIEGDDVRLENTTAAVVRGRRVAIGTGCKVRRVEYRDTIEVHPDAVVGDLVRLSPAHGQSVSHPLSP